MGRTFIPVAICMVIGFTQPTFADDDARSVAKAISTTRPVNDPLRIVLDRWLEGKEKTVTLASPNDPAAISVLKAHWAGSSGEEWHSTRLALGILGDRDAIELAAADLRSTELFEVERAVTEMMIIRRSECLPPLLALLDDKRPAGIANAGPREGRMVSAPAGLAALALGALIKNPPAIPAGRNAVDVWREWKKTTDLATVEIVNPR